MEGSERFAVINKELVSYVDNNCRMAWRGANILFFSSFLSPKPRRPQGYTRAPGPGVSDDAKTTPAGAGHLTSSARRGPAAGWVVVSIGLDRIGSNCPSRCTVRDVTTLGSRSLALASNLYYC